tara:strand:- start:4062 stop:5363 length:1302 start_codon:yes stop_codon:yes gene_type:complete
MNNIGNKIHELATLLWPINRSITGEGNRKTLAILKKIVNNLKIYEVKSGKKIYDWVIPDEWNIKAAWIKNINGKKIIDFKDNNLHIVSYSSPVNQTMTLKELKKNLYSIPSMPKAIPYVTSYYKKNWGFCIEYEKLKKLKNDKYKVLIDSNFKKGSLTYGEILLKGKTKKEIFISTYICHPSMANNELSGPTILIFIAKWLKELKNRYYSYRIVFVPETIGSLTYIHQNFKSLKTNVIAGFNLTCIGDEREYTYIDSRDGNTIADKVVAHTYKFALKKYQNFSWLDRGSDERQYCSPDINLPLVTLMRSKFDRYPEYHTSLDNLKKVVTPKGLNESYNLIKKIICVFENNFKYKVNFIGEPHFTKYNLYHSVSNKNSSNSNVDYKILRNIISYCDGNNNLLDIANKLNCPVWELYDRINMLEKLKIISKKNIK